MDDYKNHAKSEALTKLAVSKSRNQRGAVVQNYACRHELDHTLKTIDSIRDKTCRSIDFEQKKFLQSLSLSTEDLRRVAQEKAARNKVIIKVSPTGSHSELSSLGGSDESLAYSVTRTPPMTRKDLLKVRMGDLPRSMSDMDLRDIHRKSPRFQESRYRSYSEGPSSNEKQQKTGSPRSRNNSPDPDKPLDPYSISSSMKISNSRGTFEACTGKSGLNAWMGKNSLSPRQRKS